MASLAPVAQWIEYLTSNQSVACSNHAGGIFYLMTSNPQERGRVSVGCVFESRRGHFLFNDFEPPGKGAGVSRLRVCPCGVQANHAGGIFYLMTSNPQERGRVSVGCVFAPAGYRRITPGTLCITTRTSRGHSQNRRARYHKRIRHCEPLIATKGRGSLSYFCHTPTTLMHLVGAKHPF